MFGAVKNTKSRKPVVIKTKMDSLIGPQTVVDGNVSFRGGLHVDGRVKGNVSADENSDCTLSLSEQGVVVGEVRVPNVQIDGVVEGDVYAYSMLELRENARITGNVHYHLLDMSVGAQVNGQLLHMQPAGETKPVELEAVKQAKNNTKGTPVKKAAQ